MVDLKRDAWPLILDHVPTLDLIALARVNKRIGALASERLYELVEFC